MFLLLSAYRSQLQLHDLTVAACVHHAGRESSVGRLFCMTDNSYTNLKANDLLKGNGVKYS